MSDLSGKVALVTGSARGIGKGICHYLASKGAAVAVTDLSLEAAEATADDIIKNGGNACAFKGNVMDNSEVVQMVNSAIMHFGHVDILVNNAGGSAALLKKLTQFNETTEDVWRWVIDLNLNGTLSCIHAVLNHMIQRKAGRIINIASIAGMVGIQQRVDYSAAKGGVIALTRALAMEVGQYGITVNAISPGMINRSGDTACDPWSTYLGRSGAPADIASLVAFLASDEASYITGTNIPCDGGRVLGPKLC